ncbi:MAG: outer membrane protein assembly factor BamD [Bacteroidales bacterium]|nr:outer membrane protein assembly factor BamD [Bacteroidales bacterium]
MFKQIIKITLLFLVIGGVTASCKYDKLLKSSNYQKKYSKALEYYNEGDYVKAEGLFEQLNSVLKATDRADTVLYYLANSCFKQEKYILAEHHFQQFYETFGNHRWAEDAEFQSAYCNYELSPRPELDQSYTRKAINKFNLFITRHPDHPKVAECHKYINELRDKLANKAYQSAKLYYDMGDYKAAVVALENSLKRFPNTSHREEIRYLILRSQFQLASNSVQSKEEERFQETLDTYYTFTSEYPDSEYSEEAEKIYDATQRNLEN